MNDTAVHPMAEAKIQLRTRTGNGAPWSDWRDSVELDPVMIPVESTDTTDVFNSTVIGLVDALMTLDGDMDTMEFRLVWSDSGHAVKGLCPVCDDVFPVSEGAPGDELNEGYDAVFCGCDPADQDD